MLNPFPSLLVYGIMAPVLIRVTAGAVLFYLAVLHHRNRAEIAKLISPLTGKSSRIAGDALALAEIIAGGLFIVGLYTQIAALLCIVLVGKALLMRRKLTAIAPLSHTAYLLLMVMCVSLLVSGAGAFAFDIPL